MDILEKVEEVIKNIGDNKDIKAKFDKDPVKVIESILGVDLPDEIVNKIIDMVKSKINVDSLDDVTDIIGGLFGKKD